MALGRRREQFQQDLMVPASALPRSPGHPFDAALNKLRAEAKFDAYVEGISPGAKPRGELPGRRHGHQPAQQGISPRAKPRQEPRFVAP